MAGQSDYLPPGLPFNRAKWPQECQLKEHYDMRACALVRQLFDKQITRGAILAQIDRTPETYREFFRDRLNYWRGEREKCLIFAE
ncbi:hypothetical protein FEM41_14735 [Jejubacter calystegiae]|uniref:Uncharacterized protein n=1 Tax=Jejubacter calystegiae TaxID=2579935 RepID=A0A4P8YMA0_9ENTR|nr:hypothetical protein [Jejubacter calystegiae]QCT20814.1 hypothetical protein FEM41_14735 [Jejubacter calystegiae]